MFAESMSRRCDFKTLNISKSKGLIRQGKIVMDSTLQSQFSFGGKKLQFEFEKKTSGKHSEVENMQRDKWCYLGINRQMVVILEYYK